MKSPEYLAINPMGKVPAIRHGNAVVTESAAICAHLADAFPAAQMAPLPTMRAAYYRWLFFAAGPLEAAAIDQALGLDITPEKRRGWYGGRAAVMDALERAVTGTGHIAGERFSAADVYCGHTSAWACASARWRIGPRSRNTGSESVIATPTGAQPLSTML